MERRIKYWACRKKETKRGKHESWAKQKKVFKEAQ